MSFTLMPLLNTTDITNIIGEFNHSVRVFETERFNEGRQSGALSYYDELFNECGAFTRARALVEEVIEKCSLCPSLELEWDAHFIALYHSCPDTLIGWCSLIK